MYGSRPEREPVRACDAGVEQPLNGHRDVAGITLAVLAKDDRVVLRGLRDTADARLLEAVEDGAVLGEREPVRGLVERSEVDVRRAAIRVP